MFRVLCLLLAVSIPLSAYAVCETELQEYENHKSAYRATALASGGTLVFSIAAAIPTGGLSLLALPIPAGLAAGSVNMDRIAVEKFTNWQRCVSRNTPYNCSVFDGGDKCGCYQGYCWAYAQAKYRNPGDAWCFTQWVGSPQGREQWATCEHTADCSFEMTCGNNNLHYGND